MRTDWTHVPQLDLHVHARVWDSPGPPVVLVAGMGMASRYWAPLASRLCGEFRLLAPDLPGFGRTRRDRRLRWPSGPDPREQADHLLAWLDAKGIGRASLVGHSTGCHTVVDLAIRHPQRVDRLILAGPAFDPRHRTILQQLTRLAWAAAYERLALFPILAVDYFRAGLPRIIQQGIRVMRVPLEEQLPQVGHEALVIGGRRDPLATEHWCRQVAAALPRGQLAMIDRAGHAMHHSAPAATADAMTAYLR